MAKKGGDKAKKGGDKDKKEKKGKKDKKQKEPEPEVVEEIEEEEIIYDDIVAISIPEDLQEKLHCVPDVDLFPDKPWVCVPIQIILDDINEKGEDSVFYSYHDMLKEQQNEVLITYEYFIQDEKEIFPGTHWVCISNLGKQIILDHLVRFYDEAVRKAEADNTKIPGPWNTLGSADEIDTVVLPQSRPLIRYEYFGQKSKRFDPPNFVVVEAGTAPFTYKEIIRSDYHCPLGFTYLPFKHECIQVGPAKVDVAIQAKETIPVNACTQINAEIEGEDKKIWLSKQPQDALSKKILEMKVTQVVKANTKKVLESIAYNQEYNTCLDDYDLLRSGEKLDVTNPDPYQTYRSFKCPPFIRGTHITYIAWHPTITGVVAAVHGVNLLAKTKILQGDSDDENFKGETVVAEEKFDTNYQQRLQSEKNHLKMFSNEQKSLFSASAEHDHQVDVANKSIDFFLQVRKIINNEVKLQYDEDTENIEAEVLDNPLPYFDYEDYLYREPPQFDDAYIKEKAKRVKLTIDPDELESASETEYRAFLRRPPEPVEIEEISEEFGEEGKEEEDVGYDDYDKLFRLSKPFGENLEEEEEEGEEEGEEEIEEEELPEPEPEPETYKLWTKGWNYGNEILQDAFETHRKHYHKARRFKGDLPEHPGNSVYFPKLKLKMGLFYKRYGPYKRTEKTYEKMAEEAKETLKRTISTESITGYGCAIMSETKPSVRMKNERVGEMDSDNLDEVYRDMLKTIKEGHIYRDACEITEIDTRYRMVDKRKDYPFYLSSGSIETEEEQVYKMNLPRVSIIKRHHIILWNLRTPDYPLLILQSPQEVSCIKFSPIDGNFLVGGTVDGQLILWDLRDKLKLHKKVRLESIKKKLKREKKEKAGTNEDLEEELKKRRINDPIPDKIRTFLQRKFEWYRHCVKEPHLQWTAMSKLENSHLGRVNDIIWVPPTQKVVDGSFEQISETDDLSLQIISSGKDGTIRIWDMKVIPEESLESQNDLLGDSSIPELNEEEEDSFKYLDGFWKPIFTIVSEFYENLPIPLTSMVYDLIPYNYTINKDKSEKSEHKHYDFVREEYPLMRNIAIAGTDSGHLVKITWAGAEGKIDIDKDGGKVQKSVLEYSALIHDGPITSVDRNRIVPELALSVGGHTFAIWSIDNMQTPLKWKKYRDVILTTGNWSAYRASTFKIYRLDGVGELWDLALRSESCHLSTLPSAGFVSCVSDPTLHENKPIICVGDSIGYLKLLTMPKYISLLEEMDPDQIFNLLKNEIENKLYLIEWREKYLKITNTPKFEYKLKEDSEYYMVPQVAVEEKLEEESESIQFTPGMDFKAIEELYEKEQQLNPVYVKKLSERECKEKYFQELYKWYVRRRGYECPWVDEKDREYYEAEQTYIIDEMIKTKKINFQDLYERMKPLLKHEKMLRSRRELIGRMQREADIIFKRKIEHIHIMNEGFINPFKKDDRITFKQTDFQKAEEEIDLCFGLDSLIFEEELRKEFNSYTLGPLFKYRDLEEQSINFREWMNDRSFLGNKSIRWVRLRVYNAMMSKGLKCVEWNNRRYKYICNKYRERCEDIDRLQQIHGEEYDPYWDIDTELPNPYVGNWLKELPKKEVEKLVIPSEPVEKEEAGEDENVDEEQQPEEKEDQEEFIDLYGDEEEKKRKYFWEHKDEDDDESISSWIRLEEIVNGADVVFMSYEFERLRRQARLKRFTEEMEVSEEIGGEFEEERSLLSESVDDNQPVDVNRAGDVYDEYEVKDNAKMEEELEETNEEEEEEEEEEMKGKKTKKKKKIKTKYAVIKDQEVDDKMFERSIQIFIGEREEENLLEKFPFTVLPETSAEKVDSDEDDNEADTEAKKPSKATISEDAQDGWEAIESKIIGEPEYCDSIPTEGSSPSDITDNHFKVIESDSASTPDEFDTEYGEFEELQNFFKYSQHARRFPFTIDESYLKEDYKQDTLNVMEQRPKSAIGRFTFLDNTPLQQLLLQHSLTVQRPSSPPLPDTDKRLNEID